MQRELVERARGGDRDAFATLAASSIARLFNVAQLRIALLRRRAPIRDADDRLGDDRMSEDRGCHVRGSPSHRPPGHDGRRRHLDASRGIATAFPCEPYDQCSMWVAGERATPRP
jgi:hypothetical protein